MNFIGWNVKGYNGGGNPNYEEEVGELYQSLTTNKVERKSDFLD